MAAGAAVESAAARGAPVGIACASDVLPIISWNDYGESHYIGGLHPNQTSIYPGLSSAYVSDMPHDAWATMAKPYIAAYKAGAKSEVDYIADEMITYWYRPHPRTTYCPFDSAGVPELAVQWAADAVFAATSLRTPATLTVTSGNASVTQVMQAGINYASVPMRLGSPTFQLERNGTTIASGTGGRAITDTCFEGIYNFNAYTGSIGVSSGSG